MINKVVQGKRVYLRPISIDDEREFIALNVESRNFHRGLASPPKTSGDYRVFVERCDSAYSACFFVCRNGDDKIVGSINLSQIFMGGFRSAYLGYHVGSRYAGQGYMTEAIQLILKHAFLQLKLNRVEANIQPGNGPSIALVRKAGFTQEGFSRKYLKIDGRWRDHERWAILAQDWTANRIL